MYPWRNRGSFLLGWGNATLHHPVAWDVRSQPGSQLGVSLCNWPRLCSRGPNSALKHPDNIMKGRMSSPLMKAAVWKQLDVQYIHYMDKLPRILFSKMSNFVVSAWQYKPWILHTFQLRVLVPYKKKGKCLLWTLMNSKQSFIITEKLV